jgi:hypothetical protein
LARGATGVGAGVVAGFAAGVAAGVVAGVVATASALAGAAAESRPPQNSLRAPSLSLSNTCAKAAMSAVVMGIRPSP